MLKFLTASAVSNQLGIPTVTTEQMSGKVDHIFSSVYTFISNFVLYFAALGIVVCVLGLIGSAAFKSSRGVKGFLSGFVVVLAAVALFYLSPDLIGWVHTIST